MSHRVGVWGVMAAVVISGALAGCAETSAELDRLCEQASEHVDDVRSQSEGLWEQAQGLSDQVQQAASAASKDASAAADSVSKALDAVEQGHADAQQQVDAARGAVEEAQARLEELAQQATPEELAQLEAERDRVAALLEQLKADVEAAQ